MTAALTEVHSGRALSERAQHSLQVIQALVEESSALTGQISNASREQVQVTRTVSGAMQTIAGITEESSGGGKETSRAVGDLVDLSERLTGAIARFEIDRMGGR